MTQTSTLTPDALTIFETVPDLYLILSPDLIILTASDAYLEATLKKRESICGVYLFEAFPDNPDLPKSDATINLRSSLEWVLKHKVPHKMALQRYDVSPQPSSGNFSEKYWLPVNTPVLNTHGDIVYIIHKVTDLTEQVQGKEALQIQNKHLTQQVEAKQKKLEINKTERKLFQQMLKQAATPICILTGENFEFEFVNIAFQELFPNHELIHTSILETIVNKLTDQSLTSTLRYVYHTGKTIIGKEEFIPLPRYEGGPSEDRYFNYSMQVRRNEREEIDGIFMIAIEVTEQVEARKIVERSVIQFQLITDALPVLIGYLDKDERYRFTNKAYETWFKRPHKEILGHTVREVVGEKAYQGVKQYIDRALAGERLDFELLMPYRDEFIRYTHIRYVPDIRDGEVAGYYALVSDITQQVEARKALEKSEQQAKIIAEELRIANERLTHVNIDLDNFIYTASHDLKAPIHNIEALINILYDALPPGLITEQDLNTVTEKIDKSILRFKRTIHNLTEVTKLQKEYNQAAEIVNLKEVIRDVRLDLMSQLEDAGAQLDIDVDPCTAIHFSEKNLRSVIYNLLSNAIKYRFPDRLPIIKIRCQEENGYSVITVQDNGLGMNVKGNQKLFTMFSRFHNHVEGSGIGLYMVKKIIENAEGRIEVESEVGVGSTFTVFLKK